MALRRRSYDYATLFKLIGELTNVSGDVVRDTYQELFDLGILAEIEDRLMDIKGLGSERNQIRDLGIEKYVRLDRTVLYCITRIVSPHTFIETGTRWGIGAFFISRAMEENNNGMLYTFDIGYKGSAMEYFWPTGETEIGFVIPNRLRRFVTMVPGDSLATLPPYLERIAPVDIYYFDSLQTYDHMSREYAIVYPSMKQGGIFMSEDTDENSAWDDFMSDKTVSCSIKYCSHLGLRAEREVSAVRL